MRSLVFVPECLGYGQAQHIAFLGRTRFNRGQSGQLHLNRTAGGGYPVGTRFRGNFYCMCLAVVVEIREACSYLSILPEVYAGRLQ